MKPVRQTGPPLGELLDARRGFNPGLSVPQIEIHVRGGAGFSGYIYYRDEEQIARAAELVQGKQLLVIGQQNSVDVAVVDNIKHFAKVARVRDDCVRKKRYTRDP
ncbi:hypothetical protein CU102_11095 [Phyllobacterium brassicacearum]|uniref:Uncharacterized protein n=1 Tax=Phyllobacterium brassicacearum TaxID=314235 RepID=A0A2P7BQS6_9HYPH|nr:hypothetical protein [Phyllobacterium brassicacearum]PSH68819.1 hypothetical protein CU102_11095 [Phyllobacterium brassicacearum]